jgi:hypothetical protein
VQGTSKKQIVDKIIELLKMPKSTEADVKAHAMKQSKAYLLRRYNELKEA